MSYYICSPMVFVDGILLIEVDFEEFIVYVAFEILCDVNHFVVESQMV